MKEGNKKDLDFPHGNVNSELERTTKNLKKPQNSYIIYIESERKVTSLLIKVTGATCLSEWRKRVQND